MLDLNTLARLAQLEGLISPDVGIHLAYHAALVPKHQAIVELGSYKGKSTCYLAAGALSGERAHVFAIDPWDLPGNAGGRFGFNQRNVRADFQQQVQSMGLTTQITAIRGFSWDVAREWKALIGLLYIDGSHTERDVTLDWQRWSPFLAKKAVVAFDDYDTKNNPGVKKVVDRLRDIPGTTWTLGPTPLIVGRMP